MPRPGQPVPSDVAWERIPRVPPFRSAPDILTRHPEMIIANQMRAGNITDAEVVVDNTMCGSRAGDRGSLLNCERWLPGMLPPGSRITYWGTLDGGQTFYTRVIEGDGSLLR